MKPFLSAIGKCFENCFLQDAKTRHIILPDICCGSVLFKNECPPIVNILKSSGKNAAYINYGFTWKMLKQLIALRPLPFYCLLFM